MAPDGENSFLVVEDDEIVQKALCEILELMNYRVFSTSSGKEAFEIFSRETIDLVMSDLVMPEMGGVKLFEALREKDPKVKMVMITGYPMQEQERQYLEQGIVAWVRKPFDMNKIGQIIREALEAE